MRIALKTAALVLAVFFTAACRNVAGGSGAPRARALEPKKVAGADQAAAKPSAGPAAAKPPSVPPLPVTPGAELDGAAPSVAQSPPATPGTPPAASSEIKKIDPKKIDVIPALDPALYKQSREIRSIFALKGSVSTSIGSSDDGKLIGGVPLPESGRGFVHSPSHPQDMRYGTVETVQILVRTGAIVDKLCPGLPLTINDLSGPEGGPIAHHWSHQAGRDVDILFFYLNEKGKPLAPLGVPLDPRGWGWDFKDRAKSEDDVRARIDLGRTWCAVQALVESAGPLLQRIFIAEHLRTLLLEHAERIGAPSQARERFGDVTCQPSTPHDDHLHIRLFCTAQDVRAGCQDMYPFFPRREQELLAQGVTPVLAKTDANRYAQANERVVTAAQARLRAGHLLPRVKQFLDQRETWLPKPHPGRPWCQ